MMRFIFIMFTLFICSHNVNGQIADKQVKLYPSQTPDSVMVLSNDTNNLNPGYSLGKWMNLRDLINDLVDVGGGGGATDLTIGGAGPTYTIESSTGTDVTIAAAGIAALSESPANTLIITATEVDGSVTNEGALTVNAGSGTTSLIHSNTSGSTDVTLTAGTGLSIAENTGTGTITLTNTVTDTDTDDQGLTITGAGPTYTIDIDSGSDVIIAAAGINTLSETPANTLVITGTEVDGSTTNETNTIEEGNSSVQSGNLNIDFQTLFDVATDGGTECNISLDLSESTTVTSVESDDWMIMHDAGSSQHQKMLWTDFLIDLIEFKDGNSSVGTGSIIDVGEGLDISMSPTDEANINLDASEFQIDGVTEGTEYVLIHDIDTTAGHQIQRRLVSSFSGGSDTNFAEDDLTYTANRTHNQSTFSTTIQGSAMSWKFEDTNGSGSPSLILEGNVEDADAPIGSLIFQYTDTDFATDQAAWSITGQRETDSQEHSTLAIVASEATSSPPVIMFEENENLSDNTQETYTQVNSGFALTQYWESSGANAITLDRGYYNVVLLSGHTGTITIPQCYGINEANTEMNSAMAPVGQEYVISNFSGSAVTIAAFNDTGSANDDYLNGVEAGTYSLANNDSVIIKAATLITLEGRWFTYD